MSVALHDLAAPGFRRPLHVLLQLIDKAEAHFEARNRDIGELANLRVAPDMNPFPFQIEAAINNAVGAAARLRGQPVVRVEGLTTVDDMRRALKGALAALDAIEPHEFKGAEIREIVLPNPKGARHLAGLDYVTQMALPNVQFHTAIAYALLRAEGVELGKRDFLGKLPPRHAPA